MAARGYQDDAYETINLVCFRVDEQLRHLRKNEFIYRGQNRVHISPICLLPKGLLHERARILGRDCDRQKGTDGRTRRYIRIMRGQLIMNLTMSVAPLLLPHIDVFTAVFFTERLASPSSPRSARTDEIKHRERSTLP